MNKEEVLNISRESNKDEGIENMEQRGRTLAFKVCLCVFIFEVVLNMIMNKQSYGICALIFTYAAIEGMVQYRFLKKKSGLLSISICVFATILSLVFFIQTTIR